MNFFNTLVESFKQAKELDEVTRTMEASAEAFLNDARIKEKARLRAAAVIAQAELDAMRETEEMYKNKASTFTAETEEFVNDFRAEMEESNKRFEEELRNMRGF